MLSTEGRGEIFFIYKLTTWKKKRSFMDKLRTVGCGVNFNKNSHFCDVDFTDRGRENIRISKGTRHNRYFSRERPTFVKVYDEKMRIQFERGVYIRFEYNVVIRLVRSALQFLQDAFVDFTFALTCSRARGSHVICDLLNRK